MEVNMKITHISNSFLKIETEGTTLITDPWVGFGHHGGWHSYPEYNRDELVAFVSNTDAVFISHLHSDHLDPDFLQISGLIKKPIILKNFKNKTLFKRLQLCGADIISEYDAFEVFTLKDFEIAIIPQMTSNTSELEDDINYDLDTSLIVKDSEHVFFNQVDNPLSFENFREIKQFIARNFGDIDVACLASAAASGYPQNYLGIDRIAEKERIIAKSLDKVVSILDILEPNSFFPAGGTYFIPGKFSNLNDHIAHTTLERLFSAVGSRAKCFALEGGHCLDLGLMQSNPALLPSSQGLSKTIHSHRSDIYPYFDFDDSSISDLDLSVLFKKAYKNYTNIVRIRNIDINQNVKIFIYDDLVYPNDANTIDQAPRANFSLENHGQKTLNGLNLHMDRKLYIQCLTKQASWNQAMQLVLVERVPNIFFPTVEFSLNFLTI